MEQVSLTPAKRARQLEAELTMERSRALAQEKMLEERIGELELYNLGLEQEAHGLRQALKNTEQRLLHREQQLHRLLEMSGEGEKVEP